MRRLIFGDWIFKITWLAASSRSLVLCKMWQEDKRVPAEEGECGMTCFRRTGLTVTSLYPLRVSCLSCEKKPSHSWGLPLSDPHASCVPSLPTGPTEELSLRMGMCSHKPHSNPSSCLEQWAISPFFCVQPGFPHGFSPSRLWTFTVEGSLSLQ